MAEAHVLEGRREYLVRYGSWSLKRIFRHIRTGFPSSLIAINWMVLQYSASNLPTKRLERTVLLPGYEDSWLGYFQSKVNKLSMQAIEVAQALVLVADAGLHIPCHPAVLAGLVD